VSDVAGAQEVAPEGSGESAPADWKAGLSEELQRDPSIAHIPDVETMAKSYVNAQRMVGADKIAIPGNHGTDEEWDQVYTKLGRPDAPEGYELEMNNVPDGMAANPELIGWFQNTAHKVGLTPKQAQTLADEYNVMAGQAEQSPDDAAIEAEAREQEGIRELQREYGKAFDNKVNIAKAVLQEHGGDGLLELTLSDGRPLGSHPDLVRTFANIGDMMRSRLGEDSIKAPKSDGSITPDDAQRELAKIEAPGGPYWDRNHPGHSAAVADALRLREFVHGDEEL
tara:strand:+ start:258 stop:1103 length:846 start_codon:yes stop_codon:yes gene_type:complete